MSNSTDNLGFSEGLQHDCDPLKRWTWRWLNCYIRPSYNTKYAPHDLWLNPIFIIVAAQLLLLSCAWPCFWGNFRLCCLAQRATKQRKKWMKKRRRRKPQGALASSTRNPLRVHGPLGTNAVAFALNMQHRDASYKASSLDAAKYPGGEADVVQANMFNDFSLEELVSIVHSTGSTVFAFDARTTNRFFEMLDVDRSGVIDVEEIFAARRNVAVRMFVEQSNSSAFAWMFEGSQTRLTKRLKPFVNEQGELDRAAWERFIGVQRDARLLFYKTNVLARGHIFFGKGLEPDRNYFVFSKYVTDVLPLIGKGWWQDFAHFQKNTHPVVSIGFASMFNPFSRFQRCQLLLVDVCVAYVLTLLQILFTRFAPGMTVDDDERGELTNNWNSTWSTFFFVTVPQVVIQRAIHSLSSAWAARDESSETSNSLGRGHLHRFTSKLRESMAQSIVTVVLLWSIAAATVAAGTVDYFFPNRDRHFPGVVAKNVATAYALSLVSPLLFEFNPSATLRKYADFFKGVRRFLRSEATSLIGKRVCVYNGSGAKVGVYLANIGEGVVTRVDEASGLCVVLLDKTHHSASSSSNRNDDRYDDGTLVTLSSSSLNRKLGISEWLFNSTHGGIKCLDKLSRKDSVQGESGYSSSSNLGTQKNEDDEDEEEAAVAGGESGAVLVLVSSQNLAPLGLIGQRVSVVDPDEGVGADGMNSDNGRMGMCIAFHRERGCYEVELEKREEGGVGVGEGGLQEKEKEEEEEEEEEHIVSPRNNLKTKVDDSSSQSLGEAEAVEEGEAVTINLGTHSDNGKDSKEQEDGGVENRSQRHRSFLRLDNLRPATEAENAKPQGNETTAHALDEKEVEMNMQLNSSSFDAATAAEDHNGADDANSEANGTMTAMTTTEVAGLNNDGGDTDGHSIEAAIDDEVGAVKDRRQLEEDHAEPSKQKLDEIKQQEQEEGKVVVQAKSSTPMLSMAVQRARNAARNNNLTSFANNASMMTKAAASQAEKIKEAAASLGDKPGLRLGAFKATAMAAATKRAEAAARVSLKRAQSAQVLAAKVDARAQFYARRFARHPLGAVFGPLLGWLILDYYGIGKWSSERQTVLEVIRRCVMTRGAAHMSDPLVDARIVRSRQLASRDLEEGCRVKIVDDLRAAKALKQMIAEVHAPTNFHPAAVSSSSVSSSSPAVSSSSSSSSPSLPFATEASSALAVEGGREDALSGVAKIPPNTIGVVVNGGSAAFGHRPHLTFRERTGGACFAGKTIHWRHLTNDLEVYVMFPQGLRVVPADRLLEQIDDENFPDIRESVLNLRKNSGSRSSIFGKQSHGRSNTDTATTMTTPRISIGGSSAYFHEIEAIEKETKSRWTLGAFSEDNDTDDEDIGDNSQRGESYGGRLARRFIRRSTTESSGGASGSTTDTAAARTESGGIELSENQHI